MINLPRGLKQLTTIEEVRAAWDELFIIKLDDVEDEKEKYVVAFAEHPKVAITSEAIFVKLRQPVRAGRDMELVDVLEIQEPSVHDIRQANKSKDPFDKAISLLGILCTISNTEIDKIKASDMALIQEIIRAFF